MKRFNYKIIVIALISIFINLALHNFGVYSLLETKLYDFRFKLRGPLIDSKNKSEIVLVEIDDEAYRLIPEPYPYPRGNVWARAVKNLTNAGAKVIAFDIQFDSDDFSSIIFEKKSFSDCNSCDYLNQDDEFRKSIEYAKDKGTKIVLASKIGFEPNRVPSTYLITPNDLIMKSNPIIGLVDHEVDAIDNVSRRYSVFNVVPSDPKNKYLSFGLQTALAYLDLDNENSEIIQDIDNDLLNVNGLSILAYRKEASFLLNYYGPPSSTYEPSTFRRYSISQIIDNHDYRLLEEVEGEDGNWMDMYINKENEFYPIFKNRSPFKDKIVIIGSVLKEDHDFNETPFFNFNNDEYPTPGLEFHANATQQLLDEKYIKVPTKSLNLTYDSFFYDLSLIIICVFVTLLISNNPYILITVPSVFFLCSLWFSFSIGLFIDDQLWIIKKIFQLFTDSPKYFLNTYNGLNSLYLVPICFPIGTIIITYGINISYNLFNEQKNKLFLKETFGRYLSPKLIDDLYESKKVPELGGQSGIRTAFFSDIASFSTIAEQLSASELVDLLNEYLSEQTEILLSNKGTLDKYQGDAIIAFFGAPIFSDDHAKKAIDTGIYLQENLISLKQRWRNDIKKWPEDVLKMKIRIGVNSGEMVTGNMGSKLNMNYTMMGEEVNLASRLESSAKFYGIKFHTTYETLKKAGLNNYYWRYIDRVTFKGFTEWRQTVEIFGFKDNTDNNLSKLINFFHRGLDHFYKRNWSKALKEFSKSKEYENYFNDEDINPSNIFIERCNKFISDPPLEKWDGHFRLEKK